MTTGGWVEGRVVRWHQWDEGLATLRIDAPVPEFEPGQFFQLGLEVGGERIRRSYSVSSAPQQPLEFYLTNVEQGALTPRLFQLKPGDRLWVESTARGFFTLRYVPRCTCLWLIATGTGLGPYLSMLRTPSTWQHAERFVLVHGVRNAKHLAYREELEELSRQRPLSYVQVISRSESEPGLSQPATTVLAGRMTRALESGALERAAGVQLTPEGHVLLCGNPDMIQEMTQLLETRGLRRHRQRKPGHVTFEKYW